MKTWRNSYFLGMGLCLCFLVAAAETAPVPSEEIKNIMQAGDLPRLQALSTKNPTLLGFKDDQGRTLLHGAAGPS